MKGQTYVILSIVFGIIIAIFAVTNVESVEVNYFFWKRKSPLILVILFSVLMGGVLSMVAGSVKYFNLKKENKQLKKELKQIQEDHSPHEQSLYEDELPITDDSIEEDQK